MPYFITQTKAGVSIKKLRLTIEPREHREKHGKFVYPKRDIEEGGGLHVYFNEYGHYVLPEALNDNGKSVYLGGTLNEEQKAEWLAALRNVATWLTPEKAQKIYDWLTDPLPNLDGSEKTVVQRKYPDNESYMMTNGYAINLADPDGHWRLRGAIEQFQEIGRRLANEALTKSHEEQSESFKVAETKAEQIPSPVPEPEEPEEPVEPEPKPLPKSRGRPMKRRSTSSKGR